MKAVSELFRNLQIRTELKGENLHGWTLESPKEGNETDGIAAGGNDFFSAVLYLLIKVDLSSLWEFAESEMYKGN